MVVLCCRARHTLLTRNPTSLDTVFLANTVSKLYFMTYCFPNATGGGFACFTVTARPFALLVSNVTGPATVVNNVIRGSQLKY